MNSFFVSCESIFRSIFRLQIITLCSVIVILFATEAILHPCFYTCTHFHDVIVKSQEPVPYMPHFLDGNPYS